MQRSTKWPMILIAMWAILLYGVVAEGEMDLLGGFALFGGGGLFYLIKVVKYILVLSTASGEVQALTS